MSIAIDLDGVSVDRGGTRAIRRITLRMEQGRWFGLIGANGSGKTSFLRAICGRLPFAEGCCAIDGEDLSRDRAARATRIGFAPPSEMLPGALRVREVLALAAGDGDRTLPVLDDLRSALELDRFLDRWIGDCSAGTRQRVAIATAFAGGQRIAILDEPFNWLDPVAAYDVRQALRGLVDKGLTLVTALHDLATLTGACDCGAVLADGRVALALSASDLRGSANDLSGFERRMVDVLRG